MTWLLGLLGFGGAVAIGVALFLGVVLSRKLLLIAAGVIAAALLVWGSAGYVKASGLQTKLTTAEAAIVTAQGETKTAEGERDKALGERDAALLAAETCSKSVAALKSAADEREAAAAPARKEAATKMHNARQKANAELAKPPSVPGDDAASAKDRAWKWLEDRKPRP